MPLRRTERSAGALSLLDLARRLLGVCLPSGPHQTRSRRQEDASAPEEAMIVPIGPFLLARERARRADATAATLTPTFEERLCEPADGPACIPIASRVAPIRGNLIHPHLRTAE